MKRAIRRHLTLFLGCLLMLTGCTGCSQTISKEELKTVLSETTEYLTYIHGQTIYGDRIIPIQQHVDDYIQNRQGGYITDCKYNGQYMYTVVRLISDTYDLIRTNLLSGETVALLTDDPSLYMLFFYREYIFVHKGETYSFVNTTNGFEIEVPNQYFINENGNLYTSSEPTENEACIEITAAKISDDGSRVEPMNKYIILYKGYNSFRFFKFYDDCVVTDKFIYKIATDEYNYCLFRHDYCKGNYYTRTHYIVNDKDGVISTSPEQSYIYLENAEFVAKSEESLKKERVRTSAMIKGYNSCDIIINYVGFSEEIPFKALKKNKYVAALAEENSVNFDIVGFIDSDNIALSAYFYDRTVQTSPSYNTFFYSTFLVNTATKKVTFLGTASSNLYTYQNVYVSEVKNDIGGEKQ